MVKVARARRHLPIAERGYAHPDVLVSTEWVAARLGDPGLRLVECDEDVLLYDTGHIPGAVKIHWVKDLNHPVIRDYPSRDDLQRLLRSKGIGRQTTLVLYGDRSNLWATHAFWVLRLYGLKHLRIMDGGRLRWVEQGGELFTHGPVYPEADVTIGARNDRAIRAFRGDVEAHLAAHLPLVDVRTPAEYRGDRVSMPEYPDEGAWRAGHIPGALSIPWERAVDPDTHCFRTATELRRLYRRGLDPDDAVITYCRIGERSAHTWFTLTYLLGFRNVRNYDGSWLEWGNLVGAPIERS
jgi:thiosulfate/3-mercaptopyruvate sulfurtransferase